MAHLLISAAHKSSGKTTISIGLCQALKTKGLTVQPFKKGPDYIDPLWLTQAAGRSCYNLDFFTMPHAEILQTFRSRMQNVEIGIIEGNKGLYDGLELDGSNSNAALAALLDAPVVLVIDARGMTRGIAPLILGYQDFDRSINIRGIILNKVGGSRHEGKLRRVIEHYTDATVIGAVQQDEAIEINERHLGLVPSNETAEAQQRITTIGSTIAAQVDLQRLLDIANQAKPSPDVLGAEQPQLAPLGRVKIGIAQDAAFGFYYPGDIEALQQAGAELVPFSPITDRRLPLVDGLFLGGGFPETHMDALQANEVIRTQIREFVEAGGPVYAECGGLMYLTRSLTWQGKTCMMAGALQADVRMHDRPQGRGYVKLRETADFPWPGENGSGRGEVFAHEFHYSSLENLAPGYCYAYEVSRGTGIDGDRDGLVYKNLLANYAHLRDVGGNHWTRRFVRKVMSCS